MFLYNSCKLVFLIILKYFDIIKLGDDMKDIIINKDNVKESEVTYKSIRVKALIINENNEILLGHSYSEYQFPGGHVEEGEDLNLALRRELKEETGLLYETKELDPYARKIQYIKDFPKTGENKKVVINYYLINDDRIPDLDNTNYTEEEKDGNYKLRYIPLKIVRDVIKENVLKCGDVSGIAQEMLDILEYYFSINCIN